MKRNQIALAALLVCALLLTGCAAAAVAPAEVDGEPVTSATAAPPAPTEAPTQEPTEAPTPEPTVKPKTEPTAEPAQEEPVPDGPTPTPVAAGDYTYNGPSGTWKLSLREAGTFTLTDPDGAPHAGEGWVTEADGTVSCGPTDIYSAEFAFNEGCSRWRISGSSCTPVEQ